MKRYRCIAAALMLVLSLATVATASLIGDEIIFQYIRGSDVISPPGDVKRQVKSGMEDVAILEEFQLNMEADRLLVDIVDFNIFSNSPFLEGFRVLGMNDTTNTDWILLGVDVETSLSGWNDSRVNFYQDSAGSNVEFNFQGMRLPVGESLSAVFEFGPNPIPIPATAALFITGIAGFFLIRRKIR